MCTINVRHLLCKQLGCIEHLITLIVHLHELWNSLITRHLDIISQLSLSVLTFRAVIWEELLAVYFKHVPISEAFSELDLDKKLIPFAWSLKDLLHKVHFHRNWYPVSEVAHDASYLSITIVWNFEGYSHLSNLFFHFSLLTCRFQRLLNDIIHLIFLIVPSLTISRSILIPAISNYFFFAIFVEAILIFLLGL